MNLPVSLKNENIKKYKAAIPCLYAFLQIAVLFLLRKFLLLTVYQTVAAYAAVCMAGIILLFLSERFPGGRKLSWRMVSDSYLMFWSGIHGVIVLGFLTCGTYYLTLTQVTIVQIVNLFLGAALYWFFYLVTGRPVTAVGIGNLMIGLLGTANYYLMRFRGAPLSLGDFKSAKTAVNVVGNYDFTPDGMLVFGLIDLLLWYLVWKFAFAGRKRKSRRFHPVSVVVTAVVVCGCIALPVMRFDRIYAQTNQFSQDTYLATLLSEIMGSTQSLPEDYSLDEVRRIIEAYEEDQKVQGNEEEDDILGTDENSSVMEFPNIVVIMNEAFSDLRVLGDFETTEPVLEYWDSIQENVIRGWANVSVLGGNTANSEYEFLTSDSMGAYSAAVPYNSYFSSGDAYPGLVSNLKELGYETVAFHPYLSSGWNRTQVYRAMGFDRILFLEDVEEELDTLRIYVSDRGDYSYLQTYFDQKEEGAPLFFFNVTMQNHGGYTYSGDNFETTVQLAGEMQGEYPQAEQYLSLMRESDKALEELLAYFEQYREPVVVVVFGDHQPNLEEGFYQAVTGQASAQWDLEQRMKQYKTPFIIWHNYETESVDLEEVSLNYLAGILLGQLGLPMSEYQQYVMELYESLPVISSLGIKTADGALYAKGSEEYENLIRDYRLLIYHHTAEGENRLEDFFEIAGD